VVAGGVADRGRAELIIDRLASRRSVSLASEEWLVSYEGHDVSAAMSACEDELTELDPDWLRVLDFRALPSRPTQGAEFA
jgi:hypothetical protein